MLKRTIVLTSVFCSLGLIGIVFAQQTTDRALKPSSTFHMNNSVANQSGFSMLGQQPAKVKSPETGWLIRTNQGEIVQAELANPFQVLLKTKYGDVKVGSESIVSLRVVDKPIVQDTKEIRRLEETNRNTKTRSFVIATLTGDIIAGESDIQEIKLKLKWGTAILDVDSVDFVSNLKHGTKTVINSPTKSYSVATIRLSRIESRVNFVAPGTQAVAPGRLTSLVSE